MASTLLSCTCTRAVVAASAVTVRRSAVARVVAPSAWRRSLRTIRTLRTRASAMVRAYHPQDRPVYLGGVPHPPIAPPSHGGRRHLAPVNGPGAMVRGSDGRLSAWALGLGSGLGRQTRGTPQA